MIPEMNFKTCINFLGDETPAKQIEALKNCMDLIESTGKKSNSSNDKFAFPTKLLKEVFLQLLNEKDNSKVIYTFQKFSIYSDVVYHSWEILKDISPTRTPSEAYQKNYLNLIDKLGLKKNPKNKMKLQNLSNVNTPDTERKILCEPSDGPKFHFNLNKAQKWISVCWSCLSAWKLSKDTHKRTLLILLDRLLPHLQDPLKTTDFFMDSLNMGGAVSMLALQGLSILILQHHLECPLLFTKLYSMFTPESFQTKFKSRLIYLSDIFLTSTTLSLSVVAAFAKRFCRLALVCSDRDVYILLHFIANLTIRYPDLKKLRGQTVNCEKDPYIVDEEDPALSNALQSCFWEAAVLRNHVLPQISKAAGRVLGLDNNAMETPIGTLLDDDQLFEAEFEKSKREVFLNHNRNPSATDTFNNYWNLTL